MMNDSEHDQHEDGLAPARLIEVITSLHKERVFVPPQVDETILGRARAHLAGNARKSEWRSGYVRWLAAAAALALGVWISQTLMRQTKIAPASLANEDVNQDGRVDILDAFALARQIERGRTHGVPDVNGDGRVDRRDVDGVAARAVKLEKGS